MNSVLLLSGGLDSLVLLARECHAGRPPVCVSFDYGQRHRKELYAAESIAAVYRVRRMLLSVPRAAIAGSALTGGGVVPHAHYSDPSQAATVVPNRNLVMLSLAGGVAVRLGADRVLFAAHAGDAAIYPDCRKGFVEAASGAMRLACGVGIVAPFLGLAKREIVALGRELDVPFSLAWSCYEGNGQPCGRCGACVERAEAEADWGRGVHP
jgi:7-cyano-7-deazaguanine synthase